MKPEKAERDLYFGFRFLVNLRTVLPLLYPKLEWALVLTVTIVAVNGANEFIAYHSGTIIGHFYNALLEHDESTFWNVFYKASLIYLGQTLLIATGMFVSWLLAVAMRKNLVTALHDLYFTKKTYYQLNHIDNHDMDNPDQRISQDAEKMTTLLAKSVLPYLLISPGVVGYYTYKTWKTAGAIGVGCVYVYFLIGTIVNRLLVSPITKWTVRLERSEGNFRYKHVSVRDNAEESAFYDGEHFEYTESNRLLNLLLRNQLFLAVWRYPAQYFQTFFDYYGGVLTYVIQVIPIFILNSYSDLTPGKLAQQISNNAFVYIYLLNSFTRLTDLAMNIGEMAGYFHRISELVEFSQKARENRTFTTTDLPEDDNTLFKAESLTFGTPDGKRQLITDLSLEVPCTQSLLVTGSSGVGKTSLLRILKQLWAPIHGSVRRFKSFDDIIFLPQRCYFPVGRLSLRQQLKFPRTAAPEDIERDHLEIPKILEQLSLSHLIAMCGDLDDNVSFEWQETLSPGEQQRLSIARVLLQKPKVVIMDEATSSLNVEMEETVYELLKKKGISYISTGHRSSLHQFHDFELRFTGPEKRTEKWTLLPLHPKKD